MKVQIVIFTFKESKKQKAVILSVIKSDVLSSILEDRENFPAAQHYFAGFGGFMRTEQGYFVSKIRNGEIGLILTLDDYLFNEGSECKKVRDLAKSLLGKNNIDLEIIKTVEL